MVDYLAKVSQEHKVWASGDSLKFFGEKRNKADHLYPSEKVFLPGLLAEVATVLDVGCARGGFFDIMRSYNPALDYVGVDIVPDMLALAVREHRDARFVAAAGHALPFADAGFDLVHCSGVVHLNDHYEDMIAEMWRVSRRYALFDMRLTDGPSEVGRFRVDFDGHGEGGLLPYHVVNLGWIRRFIEALPNPPGRVTLAGYRHPVSHTADLPGYEPGVDEVIMAFLLLDRDGPGGEWRESIAESAAGLG